MGESVTEDIDQLSVSEIRSQNEELRKTLEMRNQSEKVEATLDEATITNVTQLTDDPNNQNWDPETDDIWVVESVLNGQKYVSEFNLSRRNSREEFLNLCEYHTVSIDAPLNLVGKSLPVRRSSSGTRNYLYLRGEQSLYTKLFNTKVAESSTFGLVIRPRYILPSFVLSGVAILGSIPVSEQYLPSSAFNEVIVGLLVSLALSLLIMLTVLFLFGFGDLSTQSVILAEDHPSIDMKP